MSNYFTLLLYNLYKLLIYVLYLWSNKCSLSQTSFKNIKNNFTNPKLLNANILYCNVIKIWYILQILEVKTPMKQAKMDKNKNVDCDKVSSHLLIHMCCIKLILCVIWHIFKHLPFCLYDFPGNHTPGIACSTLLFDLQEHYDLFGLLL